jgi:complex III assembly factor LYRM7
MASLRRQALSGYRRLIRASEQTFNGDAHAIREARKAIRASFVQNLKVTDTLAIQGMLKGIDEAESMLRFHIVQGKKNERGSFEVKLTDPQKSKLRKDEELMEVTSTSVKTPIVTRSGPSDNA